MIVFGIVIVWCWFVFSKTEIAATAAATTTIATSYNAANKETCLKNSVIEWIEMNPFVDDHRNKIWIDNEISYLASWWCDNEICIHIFLAKLFSNVQTKWAIVIVDISFRNIAQYRIGSIDFFELKKTHFQDANLKKKKTMQWICKTYLKKTEFIPFQMHRDCLDFYLDGILGLIFGMFSLFRQVLLFWKDLKFRIMYRQRFWNKKKS